MNISEKIQLLIQDASAVETAKANIKQAIIDKGVDLTDVPFTSYHTKIAEISGEGGDPGETPTDGDYLVRFFDYDGTILKEEWVNHGEDATPPDLPNYSKATDKRPALTFQGWNNSYTNITGNKDIGATYIPTDGKTHAFVRLTKVSGKDLPVYLNKSDASELSIDWGDNITTTHTNNGNFNTSHTYSDYGDYEIKIWISSGSGGYSLGSGSSTSVFVGGTQQTQRNMLMYLFIGNNASSIENYAFYNCYSLTNIVIPENVSSIGSYAFQNCYSLTSIVIPESVSSIEQYAFLYCYSLTSIVIPESVSSIWFGAFDSCYSLTNIVIPENVSSIESYAFNNCYSLTNIVIPENVSKIGGHAFYNCYSLTNIVIPENVSSIGSYAFQNCYSLTSIVIPENVSSIGRYAFRSCYSLTSIVIPENVSSIESYAFYNCYSILKYVFNRTTPPTLANTNAFSSINSICKIYVPDESVNAYKTATNWVTYADYIYPMSEMEGNGGGGDPGETPTDGDYLVRFIDYDGTILKEEWVNHGEDATPPELPDYSVATATRPALTFQEWNRDFTNITEDRDIGATYITTDGKTHAFVRLTEASGKKVSLYLNKTDTSTLSIDWGDNTTTTHKNNGNFNTSHTYSDYGDYEIKIWISSGNGLYSFGNGDLNSVFVGGVQQTQRDMLMYLFIGNNVSSIGNWAFSGCSSLPSMSIPSSVTSIGVSAFYDCSSLTNIVIPNSVTSIEVSTFNDCSGLTSIVIPDSVTSIGNSTFSDCSSLTSIVIPDSVTSIGGYAFKGCYSLTSIDLPANLSSIGESTFSGCSGLTSIVIPDSVTSIGNSTFSGCSSLPSMSIPSSVTSIGGYAFQGCYSLTSIDLPANLSSIGESTFSGCSGLTSISIPSSVTSIGNNAFYNCSSLTSINLPTNLSSIGSYAFDSCSSLTSIVIPDSVTRIGSYAFKGCTSLEVNEYDNGLYLGNTNNPFLVLIEAKDTSILTIVINSRTKLVADAAFDSCSSLTSIVIPDSVTRIGSYAFKGCSSLTSISIPSSVTSIGSGIIDNCTNLTDVYFAGTTETWIERFGTKGTIFYFSDSAKTTVIVQCSNGDVEYEFGFSV